jgi:hypothetical protein
MSLCFPCFIPGRHGKRTLVDDAEWWPRALVCTLTANQLRGRWRRYRFRFLTTPAAALLTGCPLTLQHAQKR